MQDPGLGAPLTTARTALAQVGATEEEIDQLIASLVLEEAFGSEGSPDEFDRELIEGTLGELPELAGLTPERVSSLGQAFVRTAPDDWKAAHGLAAQAVLEAAWSEGPSPVNHEHVEEALGHLKEELGDANAARAGEAVKRFLTFLHRSKLISKRRLERLGRVVDLAGLRGPGEPGALQ